MKHSGLDGLQQSMVWTEDNRMQAYLETSATEGDLAAYYSYATDGTRSPSMTKDYKRNGSGGNQYMGTGHTMHEAAKETTVREIRKVMEGGI